MSARLLCIATKPAVLLALLLAAPVAVAEPVGVVSDSTGPLLAKGANGSIKVLAVGSAVEPSDTLVSRAGAYARVTLTDHSALTLGPDTELVIDEYSFHEDAAQPDAANLRLLKGRVRITSGILGTRATDTFTLTAGTASVDIHRSTFIAEYIQPAQGQLAQRDVASPSAHSPSTAAPRASAIATGRAASGFAARGFTFVQMRSFAAQAPTQRELRDSDTPGSTNSSALLQLAQNAPAPPSGGLSPGLYVQVLDGAINVSNAGGTQNFAAGQFGYTPSFQQPPVILPTNPGMQFTPPPSFSAPTPGQAGAGSKPGDVDCIVR